jgi:hypothetical protein
VSIVVDISEISAIVAAAGVLVGGVIAVLELRNVVKQRQADMVIGLYATFGSAEFQKAYQKVASLEFKNFADYTNKYSADIEVTSGMYSTTVFFEGIGVLAKRKLINIDLVDDLFSSPISGTWERVAPIMKGYRELWKNPSVCESFEYLYNEMKKREQQLAQRKA